MRTLSSLSPQKSLLKKARNFPANTSARRTLTLSMQKSGLAHAELREQSFHLRYGRLHKQRHSPCVELADDVILLDKHGHRVPTPDYAKVPIDKLPRFQKNLT